MIQISGYEVIGSAGFGAAGTAWNVRGSSGEPAVALVTSASVDRLASLQALQHPHLPAVHAVLESAEGNILVLELVPGSSLGIVMGARRWATASEVAGLWRALADAVAVLHHRGLVHGDVSPANVVMAEESRPVLIDIVGHSGKGSWPRWFHPT